MTQYRNTTYRYGVIAIFFHWLLSLMLILQLGLGLYMAMLPRSMWKLKLYGIHKEWGFIILFLVTLRLLWRWSNIVPLLNILPAWERISARVVHWGLYFLMFAMPITGWLLTSAADVPVSFFGLFVIPNIIPADKATRILFAETHEILGFTLIALIVLHFLAACKHEFIDKDDILRRML